MSIAHLLERFEGVDGSDRRSIPMSEIALEEEKLAAFERGYKAGWDDAAKAQSEDRDRVTSDFANNLQALSFTYHEAYGQLARALKPVLLQIVEKVLPEIAHKSLAPRIAEQLFELANRSGQQDVEIVVAPENSATMLKMLERQLGFPVRLVEEPSLGAGQAYLRFADGEREIDHGAVLSGIGQAVDAFFHELEQSTEKEAGHAG